MTGGFFIALRLMRRILIQSFPNREIRATVVREPGSVRKTHESNDETEEMSESGSTPTCHSRKTREVPTDSQSQKSSDQGKRPGHGGLPRYQKFSTYARRQILRAGGALERTHPHHECLFLTLTHPGSTKVSMEVLARYSAKAVKMVHDWIGNHVSTKLSIYTWEWQQRGALHLHYVFHCPNREKGEWIRQQLKGEWIKILDAICKASGVDLYRKNEGFTWANNKDIVRVDAQWCEKSLAAYLSKYVSKAAKDNYKMPQNAFCPSRWYGVSRPLLQLLKEMSFKMSLMSLTEMNGWSAYEECLSVLQSWSIKCYEYRHKVGDGRTVVAYCNTNEQESIWTTLMNQLNINPDSCSSTEKTLRRLAQNGVLVMRKHKVWHDSFTQFCKDTYIYKVMQLPSFKDISRHDLTFLLDMLAYSFRYTQRTRFDLPGECKLWYAQTKEALSTAPPEDKEWIGALKV